jgi:hypothetical protein
MSNEKPKQPALEALYVHLPGHEKVRAWEILSALEATACTLSNMLGGDDEHCEGLANAVRVLSILARECHHGGDVILKPQRRVPGPPKPRKTRPKPQTGAVVSLVRSPAA